MCFLNTRGSHHDHTAEFHFTHCVDGYYQLLSPGSEIIEDKCVPNTPVDEETSHYEGLA